MAATAAQIAQVRRMVADTAFTYSYDDIGGYIEAYPCMDERGEDPYTWDTSTEPPTQDDNDNWIATYDLAAAAADIWAEKGAALSDRYDLSDQGRSQSRSQLYEHAMAQARYWRARRKPKSVQMHKWPTESQIDPRTWIANLAEPED